MFKIRSLILTLLTSLSLLFPFQAFAAPTAGGDGGGGNSCVTGDGVVTLKCVPIIFSNLVYWALVFAGVVALFFIIFSGIKFLTSQGDPKQVEGARKTLTYAILGLVLILSSFAILIFIADTTGVGCIKGFTSKGFESCQ